MTHQRAVDQFRTVDLVSDRYRCPKARWRRFCYTVTNFLTVYLEVPRSHLEGPLSRPHAEDETVAQGEEDEAAGLHAAVSASVVSYGSFVFQRPPCEILVSEVRSNVRLK